MKKRELSIGEITDRALKYEDLTFSSDAKNAKLKKFIVYPLTIAAGASIMHNFTAEPNILENLTLGLSAGVGSSFALRGIVANLEAAYGENQVKKLKQEYFERTGFNLNLAFERKHRNAGKNDDK